MPKYALCAYIDLNDALEEAQISFNGMLDDYAKKEIRKTPWLHWEKRMGDKGREKWFLIADLSYDAVLEREGLNRDWALATLLLEQGMILFYRTSPEDEFDDDYKKYVYRNNTKTLISEEDSAWDSEMIEECLWDEEETEQETEPDQFHIPDSILIRNVSDLSQIICLDSETTGVTYRDEMLHLSIIDGHGRILFDEYFKPKNKISWEKAMAINNITPEFVQDKPPVDDFIDQIQEIVEGAKEIVGYNISFDFRFLSRAGINIPRDAHVFDVMEEFTPIFAATTEHPTWQRPQKLTKCASFYGYESDGEFHDSLEDARATLHCYLCMTSDPLEGWMKLEEKERRKALGLPVTKDLKYINGNIEYKVVEYRVVDIYQPSNTPSLIIELETGEEKRILASFFAEMQ